MQLPAMIIICIVLLTMKPSDFIVHFPILKPDICTTLIENFEDHPDSHVRRFNEVQQFTELNLHDVSPDLAKIVAIKGVQKAAEAYADVHLPWGNRFWPENYGLEQIRVKRYNEGDCFKQHVDIGSLESSKRFLAFLFYLNDDYEGGETLFKTPDNHMVRPLKGNVVVFPPTWQYPHSGLPVTRGTKYIMSSYLNYV